MANQVAVRRARDDDVALLLELNREVQALHAAGEPRQFKPVVAELAPFAALVADPEAHVFIGEAGGAAAGYCVCKVLRRPDGPFSYAATALYIDQMAVLSAYHRRGVGAALIDQAKTLATEVNADWIDLEVWSFNTGAQQFYAAQGFAPAKHRMRMNL